MNAVEVFSREGVSTASPIKTADDVRWAVMRGMINKLTDAVYDADLYESDDEAKPRLGAIIDAAFTLASLPSRDAAAAEIEPYSGELGLVWKSGRAKRVKAMFGQERNSYSVYFEQMLNGHVVDHHLEPHLDIDDNSYLRQQLAWLHT
jgi:hypothetical protein